MISGIYSALSGLLGFSRKVESTANNVANVNTPGFKSNRVTLQDAGTQSVSSASGPAQVGRGVAVSSIDKNFSQGSLASSENPTDLAIGGQGFFTLRHPESSEADRFSRSGDFHFNAEGYLVNANGYYVQGWEIDSVNEERQGSIGNINVGKSSPPTATEHIDMIVNLDARESTENGGIYLFDAWDGRNAAGAFPSNPIDATNYNYSSSIKIYDSQGGSHDITIYFDRTSTDNEWEFLVTADPLEDQRYIDPNQQTAYAPFDQYNASDHKGAGALMYGIITFNGAGAIKNISAYNVPPDGQIDLSLDNDRIILGSSDAYYSFPINFTGDSINQFIELNLGASFSGQGTNFIAEARSSTAYASNSSTSFQDQDGFAAGFLQSISVDSNGIISGRYTNGQILKRAQVALTSFDNPSGLFSEGGNLYSANTDSGAPITGLAGTSGLGTIAPNALELSNVELTEELPNLMISQRFYQANLKIIQTTEEMLGSLLDIKG